MNATEFKQHHTRTIRNICKISQTWMLLAARAIIIIDMQINFFSFLSNHRDIRLNSNYFTWRHLKDGFLLFSRRIARGAPNAFQFRATISSDVYISTFQFWKSVYYQSYWWRTLYLIKKSRTKDLNLEILIWKAARKFDENQKRRIQIETIESHCVSDWNNSNTIIKSWIWKEEKVTCTVRYNMPSDSIFPIFKIIVINCTEWWNAWFKNWKKEERKI